MTPKKPSGGETQQLWLLTPLTRQPSEAGARVALGTGSAHPGGSAAGGTALARVRGGDCTRAGGSRRSLPQAGAHRNHLEVASQTCSRVERKFKHQEIKEQNLNCSHHMTSSRGGHAALARRAWGRGARGHLPGSRLPQQPREEPAGGRGLVSPRPDAASTRRPPAAAGHARRRAGAGASGRTSCPGCYAGSQRDKPPAGDQCPRPGCRPGPALVGCAAARPDEAGRTEGASWGSGTQDNVLRQLGGPWAEGQQPPPTRGAQLRKATIGHTELRVLEPSAVFPSPRAQGCQQRAPEGHGRSRGGGGGPRQHTLESAAQAPAAEPAPAQVFCSRPRRPSHGPQQTPPSATRDTPSGKCQRLPSPARHAHRENAAVLKADPWGAQAAPIGW